MLTKCCTKIADISCLQIHKHTHTHTNQQKLSDYRPASENGTMEEWDDRKTFAYILYPMINRRYVVVRFPISLGKGFSLNVQIHSPQRFSVEKRSRPTHIFTYTTVTHNYQQVGEKFRTNLRTLYYYNIWFDADLASELSVFPIPSHTCILKNRHSNALRNRERFPRVSESS